MTRTNKQNQKYKIRINITKNNCYIYFDKHGINKYCDIRNIE